MVEETLENGLTMEYAVSVAGLVTSVTYPDKGVSSYQYASGQLSSIDRNGYSYHVNVPEISLEWLQVRRFQPHQGKLTQAMDLMGRRTLMHHEAFSEERTAFDPVGCCLERVIDGNREAFSYDFLCQLTSDNGRSASYDSLHRRIETEGNAASHNARHQLLSHGGRIFQYDIDGRRTNDDRYRYTYDACDRLTAVEDDTTRYEYTYDPFNRRLSSRKILKGKGRQLRSGFCGKGSARLGLLTVLRSLSA